MHPTYRRILGFFVLACALSWAGNLGNYFWPSDYWATPINPLGPIIAAPIIIGLSEGRRGLMLWLRRITCFRAPLAVYAWAFCVPLAIIGASFALTAAGGANVGPVPSYGFGEILMALPMLLIAGPGPEEPAFRGFALHELQRHVSPLAASLAVGLGVMVWHLPLLLVGDLPATVMIPLAGVAVVYGWLYQTGRSVWPLVLLHFQLNFVSAGYTGPMMPDFADQATYLGWLGVFYIVWAIILVVVAGPSLGRDAMPRLRRQALCVD
jgi:membrane protease YdiL (CAAX protease family)